MNMSKVSDDRQRVKIAAVSLLIHPSKYMSINMPNKKTTKIKMLSTISCQRRAFTLSKLPYLST